MATRSRPTVGPSLPTDAVNTLLNCMLIDDQGCARGVVEARAKTDAILYGQVTRSRTTKTSMILSVYSIQKGKDPVGMRRTCESCTKELMASMLDEVLGMVVTASAVERGRLAVHSRPEGLPSSSTTRTSARRHSSAKSPSVTT